MISEYQKYFENNDFDSAEKWLIEKLELYPENAELYFELSKVYYRKRNLVKCEQILDLLVFSSPNNADFLHANALLKVELEKFEEAEELYDKAIAVNSGNFELFYNKGVLLAKLDRDDEAVLLYQRAIELKPDFAKAYYNISDLLMKNQKRLEAKEYLVKCLEFDPKYVDALYNLGCIYEGLRDYISATKYYLKTLEIDSTYHDARWNGSLQLLRRGDYIKGFELYEERLNKIELKRPDLIMPFWNGEELNGKKILVYYEQGFGDFFQFVRYLKNLKKLNCEIILEIKPEIQDLMKQFQYVDKYVNKPDGNKSDADYKVALLSLPNIYKSELNTIPNDVPYLWPTELKLEKFRKIISLDKFSVGIFWSGNPDPPQNRIRHTKYEEIENLFKNKNINFYSLQIGEEAKKLKENKYDNVFDLSEEINDFTDTAAIIANVDLVITIDTSVVHLAGALNKETWLLLCQAPDWRWFDDESHSLWYPSVKYFRKPITGNWDIVIGQIIFELKRKLTERKIIKGKYPARVQLMKDINSNNFSDSVIKKIIDTAVLHYDPDILIFLSDKFLELNKVKMAEEILLTALEIFPDDLRIQNRLADIKVSQNDINSVSKIYKNILEVRPDHKSTLLKSSLLNIELNNNDQAIDELKTLIDYYPREKIAIYNLALVLYKIKDVSESEKYFEYLYELYPEYLDGFNSFLHILVEQNKIDAAINLIEENKSNLDSKSYFYAGRIKILQEDFKSAQELFKKALTIDESNYQAYINLGYSLYLDSNFDEALNVYNSLLKRDFNPEVLFNIAVTYQEKGELSKAKEFYKEAINLSPDDSKIHTAYAEVLMLEGNYKQGFNENEWRTKQKLYLNKQVSSDNFDLNDLKNKTILIYDEQGFGDIFNFLRYVKILKKHGANIIIETRPELKDLLEGLDFIDEVLLNIANVEFDFAFPIVSLPNFIKYPDKFFYNELSYISPRNLPEKKLDSSLIKIGIVWEGKKDPIHNRKRHLPLEDLIPILENESASFYSLNFGELSDIDKDILSKYNVADLAKNISSFLDTASFINELDLIITVDTVVAHLAAAMGKETWIMLSKTPDWRWGIEGEHSIWYPLAKLFRQQDFGDWGYVVAEIKDHLLKRVEIPGEYYLEEAEKKLEINDLIACNYFCNEAQKTINNNPRLFNIVGILFGKFGNVEQANKYFRQSLQLDPENFDAKLNSAILNFQCGDIKNSIKVYNELLLKDDQNIKLLYNYGVALFETGNYDAALDKFNQVLELDQTYAVAGYNKALIELLNGNLINGFSDFVKFHRIIEYYKYKNLSKPEWQGESLKRKKLFIYCAQGYGDIIQFSRYFALLKKLDCEILFECPKTVSEFVKHYGYVDEFFDRSENFIEPEYYDFWLELYSLPVLFNTNIDSIPDLPNFNKKIFAEEFLLGKNKFNVGIAWQGNPNHKNDKNRSCSPVELFKMLENPNVNLYSLQLDDVNSKFVSEIKEFNVINISSKFNSLLDTAEYINQMDIIITVDTLIAHLAASLNKEVWLMIPFVPDWRWLIDRKDSPWYPTIKIFRQKEKFNWEDVFGEIKKEINKKLSL